MRPSTLRLRGDRLSWRVLDGEVVALDAAASAYLGANQSGAILWELLAAGTTRPELATALVDRYGLDRATAEADVDRFVADLRAADLLEESA